MLPLLKRRLGLSLQSISRHAPPPRHDTAHLVFGASCPGRRGMPAVVGYRLKSFEPEPVPRSMDATSITPSSSALAILSRSSAVSAHAAEFPICRNLSSAALTRLVAASRASCGTFFTSVAIGHILSLGPCAPAYTELPGTSIQAAGHSRLTLFYHRFTLLVKPCPHCSVEYLRSGLLRSVPSTQTGRDWMVLYYRSGSYPFPL